MANVAPRDGFQPQMTPAEVAGVVKSPRPHVWEMLLHPVKTVQFVLGLAGDRHISLLRKALYVGPIVVLVLAVLLPESVLGALLAVVLPVVGPILSIPADATVDWALIGIAAYGLLGILPREIVSEHHARLFHPDRLARARRRHMR